MTLYGEPEAIRVDVEEDPIHPAGVWRGNGAVSVNFEKVGAGDVKGVVRGCVGRNVTSDPGGGAPSVLSIGRRHPVVPLSEPNSQLLKEARSPPSLWRGMGSLPEYLGVCVPV